MFTSVIGNFLNNIQSLRIYIDSVELFDLKEINGDDINSDIALATFMLLAKETKMHNTSLEDILEKGESHNKADEATVNFLRETIAELEKMVEISADGKTGQYRRLPKNLKEAYRKIEAMQKQRDILYSGALLLLVTYFENMISKSFKIDFHMHPQRMSLDNKTVSYKLLEQSNNIEDIKELLIEEEITTLMYKSVSDWIDYLKRNLNMELLYASEKLPNLKEIIARRNIIVHNEGVVNNIYLRVVDKNFTEDIEIGDKLYVDERYIHDSIELVESIGVALMIEMWLKESGQDSKEIDKILAFIFDEYLIFERWEDARVLYEICLKSKKLQDADMLLCKINRWQCYKWLGQFATIKKEIEDLDVSASKTKYQLGVLALLDKYEEFFSLFEGQNEIGEDELNEWPLFRGIRECEQYKQYCKKDIEVETEI